MTFSFHPELFEFRGRAMAALEEAGFAWFSHFGSVDLLHDEYGLEVCGIHQQDDAHAILDLLRRTFPDWHCTRITYRDYGRDIGWRALVCEGRRGDDTWTPAGTESGPISYFSRRATTRRPPPITFAGDPALPVMAEGHFRLIDLRQGPA